MLISYILPSYKKFALFVQSIRHNHAYFQPSAEVVIVLDEPSEEKAYLHWIEGYGRHVLRPRLIVNDIPHEWRPPCRAINVGIRHSLGKYCAVLSPETVLKLPQSDFLTQQIASSEASLKRFYMTGVLSDILASELSPETICDPPNRHYMRQFGFVLFNRTQAIEIGGYDERRMSYGQDDDDIRNRLKRSGATHINLPSVRALHVMHAAEVKRDKNRLDIPSLVPHLPAGMTMGLSFDNVIYDWRSR